MSPSSALNRSPARADRTRLLLVRASLLLILIGMIIVGRRNGIWPVINWPMYARLFEMPESVVNDLRIDLITTDGRRTPFLMREIAPIGEHQIVAATVHCTQLHQDPAVRERCARLIEALARSKAPPGDDLRAIEMWEVQWEADVRALPPLDRKAPDRQHLVGRLDLRHRAVPAQDDSKARLQ